DFTVRKVAAGYGVEAAKEGAAHAAGVAVVDTFFAITDVFASGQCHESPLLTYINDELPI
ncbi:MAG: hypothetical protein QUT30_03405, partial [Acidobacteriota bacterium]|nr:hypothetical protein [Acidobacteriota bacterium]